MNIDNVLYAHKILGSGRKTKPSGVISDVPSSVYYGDTINISWGASIDSDVTYFLEVQFDNEVWGNIYTGSATNISYTIPNIAYSNCKFRVSCCKLGLNFSIYIYSNNCALSKSPIPGNSQIVNGDDNLGYFGSVSNLIIGNNLRSLTGVTNQGTTLARTYNGDSGGTTVLNPITTEDIIFSKFKVGSKYLFIPNKGVTYGIAWDEINTAGCVFGKIIYIGGFKFTVRLMKSDEYINLISKFTPGDTNKYVPHNWGSGSAFILCQNDHPTYTTACIACYGVISAIDVNVHTFTKNLGKRTGSNRDYDWTDYTEWRPVLEMDA